jgi:hypothetical protein
MEAPYHTRLRIVASIVAMFITVATVLAGPAPGVRPPSVLLSDEVRVLCNGRWQGWAAPISASTAVTAFHVVDDCVTLGWRSSFKEGRFVPLKTDKAQDTALLLSDAGTFDQWFDIAHEAPQSGEPLWWTLLLPGKSNGSDMVPVAVSGLYLGVGDDGSMYTEGPSHPGSSGSAIVNSEGKLVGVVSGFYNAMTGASLQWGSPIKAILK